MDWTKAKTILIMALLITNIFLVSLYALFKGGNGSEDILFEETINLLNEKQIYIKGDLPSEKLKMPVLSVEYDQWDDEQIDKKLLDQEVQDRTALEIVEGFLKDYGVWSESIVLDMVEEDEDSTRVSFRNEYEGIPIEDSYISATVEGGKITEIDRLWLNPLSKGKSKKATISASAALIELMRSKDSRTTIVVERMEMVYWLDPSDYIGETAISDTALPAWKITYNGGKVKYVPAYSD